LSQQRASASPSHRSSAGARAWAWHPIVTLALILTLACGVRPAKAEVDAEQVRNAIDKGIAYLKREQNRDGSWSGMDQFPSGVTSLCTLALLTAGVPRDDPQVAKAISYLRQQRDLKFVYSRALQTMVFCAADPKRDLFVIRQNVQWLESFQNHEGDARGSWSYGDLGRPLTRNNGDNSNTQFALLALHEAERAGVPVKDQTWRNIYSYWQRTQNLDGSWGYRINGGGTGSMTSAGIAAMVIADDRLHRGDAEVQDERVLCCGRQQRNETIERALAWMAQHFSLHTNPGDPQHLLYYYYGLERVGRLTNQRLIGQHDWYREGAELLVNTQDKLSGFWRGVGSGESDPRIGTSLALLFLAKGRRPVLVAKLKHAPLDDWNHHRTDVANLTGYAEQRWQRELTWQVIDIRRASPDDLNQVPVLFLSGREAPELTELEVLRLREYIDHGGFLFAEDCCNDGSFDPAFRKLMEQIFPEPEHQLRLLPPEHPIWSAEEPVDPQHLSPLWGVDVGCRTSVVYSPKNLGCYWELARPDRELKYPDKVRAEIQAARAIGINVLAYATNREVKYKLEIPPLVEGGGAKDKFDRARLYVAKIRHRGNWNIAPGALPNLMQVVSQQTGLRISMDTRELSLADPRLFDYPLVFMHGRNAFQLTAEERKQLHTYVERGGVLFADAVCSSKEFAESFRAEMKAAFPDVKLQPIPASHPLFTPQFGGFDLKTVARREPRDRAAGGMQSALRQVPPELEGIEVAGAYGVLFSPYDLSCALERHESLECTGYTRDDAARIGLNIVLYALQD
jgi:hypothetical protein